MDFRDWLKNDYYHILGIDQSATNDEINKAYRLKAKQTHPDTYPFNSNDYLNAEKSFKQLLHARDTLLDSDKRDEYDKERLTAQECYVSFISTSYTIPFEKKEEIKPISFKEKLKEKLVEEENDYIFSAENNIYQSEKDIRENDDLSKEEKAMMYKHEGAKKFYMMGLQAIGYKDYRRAMMYFRSAQYLNPRMRVPNGYFPSNYREE